jgi:D-alanine transaminase/branched-chain amino acid aminotransferase
MSAPPQSLAYLNGQYLTSDELRLPVYDAGFVFGATVTDLCRTFRHRLFRLDDHLTRFRRSCQKARIPQPVPDADLRTIAERVVAHNAALLPPTQDLALVLFATPGPIGSYAGREVAVEPTLGLHTFPLPVARYRQFFAVGASLMVPPTRHVPPEAVDPRIKQRSRLSWWIAEREVQEMEPGASALLLDASNHVTETAAANLLIVRAGTVLTPPRSTVLEGISLKVIEEICDQLSIPFREQTLTLADCQTADEAMLSCTSFCLAGVRSVQGVQLPWPGPIFLRLLTAWSQAVNVDIRGQFLAGA